MAKSNLSLERASFDWVGMRIFINFKLRKKHWQLKSFEKRGSHRRAKARSDWQDDEYCTTFYDRTNTISKRAKKGVCILRANLLSCISQTTTKDYVLGRQTTSILLRGTRKHIFFEIGNFCSFLCTASWGAVTNCHWEENISLQRKCFKYIQPINDWKRRKME